MAALPESNKWMPKITVVNLEGFDHPVNHHLLKSFSKNVQYISFFDDNLYNGTNMTKNNSNNNKQEFNGQNIEDYVENSLLKSICKSSENKNFIFFPLSSPWLIREYYKKKNDLDKYNLISHKWPEGSDSHKKWQKYENLFNNEGISAQNLLFIFNNIIQQ